MGCESNTCESAECNGGLQYNSGCCMTDKLLAMSDKAWECLMLEKMKKHLESKKGAKMDKVALAVVEGSIQVWEGHMQGKGAEAMTSQKIQKIFSE